MSTENINREGEWFEDKQGLLNPHMNQETRDWAHFTDSSQRTDSSITSSGDSEDDSCDEIWTVSDEQRDYYTKQFKTMQTDLTAMISGNVSKQFFEKSGLPIDELSKIWELSDVNRDGALSLDEFWTAMHLVVLRRNNIELPDCLPIQLVPYAPLDNSVRKDDDFSTDRPRGSTIKRISPINNEWSASFSRPRHSTKKNADSSAPSEVITTSHTTTPTTITTAPTTPTTAPTTTRVSPSVSLPNPMPNFVTSVSVDSTVAHPIARHCHLSPADLVTITTSSEGANPMSPPKLEEEPLSRPRPTPNKSHTAPAFKLDPTSRSRLLPPPTDLPTASDITCRSHMRSSSLDTHLDTPPVVPPRLNREMSHDLTTPGHASSNELAQKYARSASYDAAIDVTHPPPVTVVAAAATEPAQTTSTVTSNEATIAKARSQHATSVRKQRRRNELISRVNSELNGDLQELMEQRIALEIQLDHLLPYPY